MWAPWWVPHFWNSKRASISTHLAEVKSNHSAKVRVIDYLRQSSTFFPLGLFSLISWVDGATGEDTFAVSNNNKIRHEKMRWKCPHCLFVLPLSKWKLILDWKLLCTCGGVEWCIIYAPLSLHIDAICRVICNQTYIPHHEKVPFFLIIIYVVFGPTRFLLLINNIYIYVLYFIYPD